MVCSHRHDTRGGLAKTPQVSLRGQKGRGNPPPVTRRLPRLCPAGRGLHRQGVLLGGSQRRSPLPGGSPWEMEGARVAAFGAHERRAYKPCAVHALPLDCTDLVTEVAAWHRLRPLVHPLQPARAQHPAISSTPFRGHEYAATTSTGCASWPLCSCECPASCLSP